MKQKILAAAVSVLLAGGLLPLAGCDSDSGKADAGALFRESVSLMENMENGSLYLESTLSFSIEEQNASPSYTFSQRNDTLYRKEPFGVHTLSVSNMAGTPGTLESYLLEENGTAMQYSQSGEGWFKAELEDADLSARGQVDVLQLLGYVTGESYLREEELSGIAAHKLELSFDGECLRGLLETLITSAGLDPAGGQLAEVLVESLNGLEEGNGLHGYCWISKEDGRLLQLELDAKDRMQQVFQAIDGAEHSVKITECSISAGCTDLGGTKFPELPEEASSAAQTEAVG